MNKISETLPTSWRRELIEDLFAPLEDGRTMHQGWSPQCEKEPSPEETQWGVLKTTAIQAGEFQPEHNKLLPSKLDPRPLLEVKPGDILLTCAGPRVRCGVACLVRRTRARLLISGKMYRFRPKPSVMEPGYLEAFLLTEEARQAIDRMKTGGSDSGLNLTHERFRKLSVPVAPLPEQRRIVAEIEKQFTRLEAGVAALKRVQANLKRYRAAVLKAACEGRLVPTDGDWKTGTLRDVLVGIETGKSFKCEERPPTALEVGVVKVSAVTWGTYDELESKTCLDPNRIEERYLVSVNDFLFSRANTIELIGACVIAKKVNLRVMLSDKILRFRFSSAVEPRWVLYWLRSDFGRAEIERLATGNQESMRNIGQDRIRQIAMEFPSLAEQARIVAEVERRLSVIEGIGATVEANLKRAARLRQSVLQKAFTGELVS